MVGLDLFDGAGDAFDDSAGVAREMVVVIFSCALIMRFSIVTVHLREDFFLHKFLQVSVNRRKIGTIHFGLDLCGRPCSILTKKFKDRMSVLCFSQAEPFKLLFYFTKMHTGLLCKCICILSRAFLGLGTNFLTETLDQPILLFTKHSWLVLSVFVSTMPTYISKEGLQELRDEFEKRKTLVRREIAEQISSAKELGDLSENFEYHDAKERQGLNEARIVQLESMINDAVIVEKTEGGSDIDLGTTFVAESGGEEKTFQVVGSTEADPMAGKISNESPIGQAFIGHKVGEKVEITVPSGAIVYTIKEIK